MIGGLFLSSFLLSSLESQKNTLFIPFYELYLKDEYIISPVLLEQKPIVNAVLINENNEPEEEDVVPVKGR
jgi:hypothetical protein